MKDIVSSACNELTDEISVKRIEFKLDDICNSSGDPNMLKQVWINLISNAIKYSSKKEKAIITIGSKREDGYHGFIYFGVNFSPEKRVAVLINARCE